jgi:hypothetical protein
MYKGVFLIYLKMNIDFLWQLFDVISCLSIAFACLFVFFLVNGLNKFTDFLRINTTTKVNIVVGANFFWLLLIPATYWYYTFMVTRGDFLTVADAIIIPISLLSVGVLVMIVPLNLFLILTLSNSILPTRLLIIAKRYNFLLLFIELVFICLALINIVCFVMFVMAGHHLAIPVNLYFMYVLLTLRAGLITNFSVTESDISLNT